MPHESTVDPNVDLGESFTNMVKISRVPSNNNLDHGEKTVSFEQTRTPLARSNSTISSRPQTPSHFNHDLDSDSDSSSDELL